MAIIDHAHLLRNFPAYSFHGVISPACHARLRIQHAERCDEGYVGKSNIPFAAIINFIEPLVIQRSSCGAVFFCRVCRLMFAEHLARQASGDPSELICPNAHSHAAICAAADEAAAGLPCAQ